MKTLVETIFGIYTPVLTTVPVSSAADGSVQLVETVASGVAGVDWPWVAGVFLFGIVLYSFFRLVGVLLRG